jgi:hypothetical protein
MASLVIGYYGTLSWACPLPSQVFKAVLEVVKKYCILLNNTCIDFVKTIQSCTSSTNICQPNSCLWKYIIISLVQ